MLRTARRGDTTMRIRHFQRYFRRRGTASTLVLTVAAVAGVASSAVAPGAGAVSAGTPRPASGIYTLNGHAWGHGRGMSQVGAQGGAIAGHSADTIIGTYYPHTTAVNAGNVNIRVALTGMGTEGYPAAGGDDHRYQCNSASSVARYRCRLKVDGDPNMRVING